MNFFNLLSIFLFIVASKVNANNLDHSQKTKKIKVLVIDSGIYPHKMLKQYLPKNINTDDYADEVGHGTHIAGIIIYGDQKNPQKVCDEVEIVSCKYYSPKYPSGQTQERSNQCFLKATKEKFDFINYSGGGNSINAVERAAIKKIDEMGTKIIVAAGNEASNLAAKPYYPASYHTLDALMNLFPVANIASDGSKNLLSNYDGGIIYDYGCNILSFGPDDNDLWIASGTSQATAMFTHRLILKQCQKK